MSAEQTFCFALISKLLKADIPCIASATARDVTILPDGSKQMRFHFSRFREYKKFKLLKRRGNYFRATARNL